MAWSAPRLRAMHDVLAGHVARGVPPGLVTLVSRHGETHVDVIGDLAVGGPPMRRDTIFRISSMTKPMIAAAALILVEECMLRLDDPVDALLPELADRRVLTAPDGPLTDTVPADRPITLRDLLAISTVTCRSRRPPLSVASRPRRRGPRRSRTPTSTCAGSANCR
jgi:CubicO group peptidase (beta-lactamase class C family)